MRILITGSDGQIGWELLRAFPAGGDVIGLDRSKLDLTDVAAIRAVLRDRRPNLIINAAGYTAVDRAEDEPDIARAINSAAVGVIGEEAKKLGAAVIHYSTDYVFDGTKTSPYRPSDQPNPQSVYGRTKLEGEQALIASGAAALILRTSWVYALRRRNFLLAVFRQAAKKPELRIVNDQTGCPTWARSIALATAEIAAKAVERANGRWTFGGREGIYHLVSGGSTTWFDFAAKAFELADLGVHPKLIAVSTEEFGAKAVRPAYSVLDCTSTKQTFGVEITDWRIDLASAMEGGELHELLTRADNVVP